MRLSGPQYWCHVMVWVGLINLSLDWDWEPKEMHTTVFLTFLSSPTLILVLIDSNPENKCEDILGSSLFKPDIQRI